MRILTFDIEEWFHILDNESTKTEKEWSNFESRIDQNMDIIFNLLDQKNVKATFFCLGWIAEKYPHVIKKIDAKGYEIGSHTSRHQLVYQQNKTTFNEDLKKSIQTIEDITGKKINSFRAPGFSITEETKWAFDVLIENGIEYDSSIFPTSRAHGGFKSYGTSEPSILSYNGNILKEFPINTTKFLGKDIIFSGGGYFRLFPYFLLKKWSMKSSYIMTYFHPRDFDYNQPMIEGLSVVRKIKSYYGLKTCLPKLEQLLDDFEFVDLKTASQQINWESVKTVKL